MSDFTVSEVFYRPPERQRRDWTMPLPLYRLARRLLHRSDTGCVFVPIRTMQFQAVIDREEVIFVDAQGGYMVQDGTGGRVVQLAWQPSPPADLDSLAAPVPCRVVYYQPGLAEVQRRLVGEFQRAAALLLERWEMRRPPPRGARVVPLRG